MGREDQEKKIREILAIWNDSSLTGKMLWILACIGASTTLTSLSGIIVEWKGLIAEMLYFYPESVIFDWLDTVVVFSRLFSAHRFSCQRTSGW